MDPQTAAPDRLSPAPPSLPTMGDAAISVALLTGACAPEVGAVIAVWQEALSSLKRDHEILVVGPESNADLAALRDAEAVANRRILTYAEPEGDGPALRTALAAATHPLFLHVPCDRQYQAKDLVRFFSLINEVHLVSGYRVQRSVPLWLRGVDLVKRILARILLGYLPPPRECWLGFRGWPRRFLARWIFGLRLQDVECRLRLFRREALLQFRIQSRGEFTQIEVLAKANHLECVMAEVPVSWSPPPVGPGDSTFWADASLVRRNPEFVDPTARPPEEEVETLAPEGG